MTVTLRNLSQDHKFSNLAFLLRLPSKGSGKFKNGAIEPIAPAYSERKRPEREDFDISYNAIGLHPGTSLRLTASYSGDTIPTFHIEPSGDGTRLLAKGPLTWIIRNEVEILIGLFVAWVGVVTIMIGKITGGGGNGV